MYDMSSMTKKKLMPLSKRTGSFRDDRDNMTLLSILLFKHSFKAELFLTLFGFVFGFAAFLYMHKFGYSIENFFTGIKTFVEFAFNYTSHKAELW
jgi:hypothetical protein